MEERKDPRKIVGGKGLGKKGSKKPQISGGKDPKKHGPK